MKRIFISALFCAVFAAAAGAQTTEIRYTYDAAGNRVSRKSASSVEGQTMPSQQQNGDAVGSENENAVMTEASAAKSPASVNPSGSAAVEEQKRAAEENKNEKK